MAHVLLLLKMKHISNSPVTRFTCCLEKKGYYMTARQKPKRILLPLDGSERSLGTVRYITKIIPFHQMQVVLFHVHAGLPESYFDLGKDPRSTGTVAYVRAWEIEKKKKAREYMEKGADIFYWKVDQQSYPYGTRTNDLGDKIDRRVLRLRI